MINWIPKTKLISVVKDKIRPAKIILDIGSGIRPQEFQKNALQICVDPFNQYVQKLREKIIIQNRQADFIVLQSDWEQIVKSLPPKSIDNIYLLDVIEHLDKNRGLRLIKQTEKIAKNQIIIFTPLGFLLQNPEKKDAWGLDGGKYQEHKSGWEPDDFDSNWQIFASKDFHTIENKKYGAFFAIKNLKKELTNEAPLGALWHLLNLKSDEPLIQIQQIKRIIRSLYVSRLPNWVIRLAKYYHSLKILFIRYPLKKIIKYILNKSRPKNLPPPNLDLQMLEKCRQIALTGRGSQACLDQGFLPVPVHFYSPLPDIKDLEQRQVWDQKSELPGIDFRPQSQLELLEGLGKFGSECNWPLNPTMRPLDFFVNNQSFSFGCAGALYVMIRHFKPKRIIEVGSGNSSKVIYQAITKNQTETKQKTHYTIIDPYPSDYISQIPNAELIAERVELVNPKIFEQLSENDLLFIDSSHSVKIGGDVTFLYLEVLPRLKPGVVIHTHDIDLPYEYPKAYATSETFRQFWTEQYLLQAFLIGNRDFEVLLGMHYIQTNQKDAFQKAFPHYDPAKHLFTSGSFWYRRLKEKK